MNTHSTGTFDFAMNSALKDLPTVSADHQRGGMRHLAAAVTIITARDGDTRVGLTATAVSSVTIEPPRMVVMVNKKVAANDIILKTGALCINLLSVEQEHLAKVFAGMMKDVVGPARFEHGTWIERVTGAPVLEGALASFDCRVVKVMDESSHNGFLCDVLATGEVIGGDPLLYADGAFRRLAPLEG